MIQWLTERSTRRLRRVENESDISSTVAGVSHHTYSLPAVDACNVDTEETFQCEMDDAIRSIGDAADAIRDPYISVSSYVCTTYLRNLCAVSNVMGSNFSILKEMWRVVLLY